MIFMHLLGVGEGLLNKCGASGKESCISNHPRCVVISVSDTLRRKLIASAGECFPCGPQCGEIITQRHLFPPCYACVHMQQRCLSAAFQGNFCCLLAFSGVTVKLPKCIISARRNQMRLLPSVLFFKDQIHLWWSDSCWFILNSPNNLNWLYILAAKCSKQGSTGKVMHHLQFQFLYNNRNKKHLFKLYMWESDVVASQSSSE